MGHIVKTNQSFECKPPSHFRLKVVYKMGVDSGDYSTIVVVIEPYAIESRIHIVVIELNGLQGFNYLYIFLLVPCTIYTVRRHEIHISQHKTICIHKQGVVTLISTALRVATGDCNPIYCGYRCGLSCFRHIL